MVLPGGGVAAGGAARERARAARQRIGTFEVPYGYELWADGVYRVVQRDESDADEYRLNDDGQDLGAPNIAGVPGARRRQILKQVAPRPIWIRSYGKVIGTGELLLEIAFDDHRGRTQAEWVSFDQIRDRGKLIGLGKIGLAIRTGSASGIEEYLERAVTTNPELPELTVATRSGAVQTDEGWGWLIGRQWIGPQGTTIALDPRYRGAFGFESAGNGNEWLYVLRRLEQFGPVVRWLLYSTFAPPIMRQADVRTFTVHQWGSTRSGKTALARFCASAWGNTQRLVKHFDATEISMTEVFAQYTDMPVVYDELQVGQAAQYGRLLYKFAMESPRGRSGQYGGLRPSPFEDWRTIVRMTGEEPIIGMGRLNLGGQSSRVIQIAGYGVGEEAARQIHVWLNHRNHGWAGPEFLRRIGDVVSDATAVNRLQRTLRAFEDAILRQVPGVTAISSALAVVALAETLTLTRLFEMDAGAAEAQAVEDAVAVAQVVAADDEANVSVAERALRLFRDHANESSEQWLDLSDQGHVLLLAGRRLRQTVGFFADHEVWIIPSAANRLLGLAGLPQQVVWSTLRERGITVREPDGQPTGLRRHNNLHGRFYVINRAAFDWTQPIT